MSDDLVKFLRDDVTGYIASWEGEFACDDADHAQATADIAKAGEAADTIAALTAENAALSNAPAPPVDVQAHNAALCLAAAMMKEWADEAHAAMCASDPSNFNVAREVERDLCREAAEKIMAMQIKADDSGSIARGYKLSDNWRDALAAMKGDTA